MTQRENYKLEFLLVDIPAYGGLTPNVKTLRNKEDYPIGGSESYYLSSVINFYNSFYEIDDLILDINQDILHGFQYGDYINDSYDVGDATFIATHKGYLIVGKGKERSHTSPDNHKIPLTDFRDLLLEWRDFLRQNGISKI